MIRLYSVIIDMIDRAYDQVNIDIDIDLRRKLSQDLTLSWPSSDVTGHVSDAVSARGAA